MSGSSRTSNKRVSTSHIIFHLTWTIETLSCADYMSAIASTSTVPLLGVLQLSIGYYRVNYNDYNWNLITNYLNTENYKLIHVLNRAQLLDDSFHLAQDSYIGSHTIFLNITRYLRQEGDGIAWYPAFRAFSYLNTALRDTEDHKLFKASTRELIFTYEIQKMSF